MNDDRRLHDAFQASRTSERAETPPFGRVVAGRVRRAKSRRGLVLALVAVAGAIAVFVSRSRGGSNAEHDLDLARRVMAWRSSTDFLLPESMPGLLSSVPRIGLAPAGSPLQSLDPGRVLGPPELPRSPRS